MADEELVAEVSVEGTDELAAKLAAYAEAGQKSFEKINAAAAKAAVGVQASTKAVEGSASDAAAALKQVGDTKISAAPAQNLKSIEQAASALTTEVRKGLKDLATFATRVAALGTAAVAAGAGVLTLAASVAKQAAGTSNALDKQTAAQIDANNASLTATQASINYNSQLRKLQAQARSGAIQWDQYRDAVKQLDTEFRDQQIVARQTAAAQDAVKEANERLTKQLADQKAYNALIDKFGGPLLTSLLSLGREVNSLFDEFKQAFGPAIGALLDAINAAITRNRASIVKFFDDAAARIETFVKENGPAITKAIEGIGQVLGNIFNGVLIALPVLVNLFNAALLPALNGVGHVLQALTTAINTLFGTNFTTGVTAAALALGTMTGAFKLLVTGVRLASLALVAFQTAAGGPLMIALTLLAGALLVIATNVDWTAFAQRVITAWTQVLTFFQGLPAQIGAVFTGMWASVVVGVTTVTKFVTDAWNTVVIFFTTLPATIGAIFAQVGTAIVEAFNSAVTAITGRIKDFATSAMSYLQPVIDGINKIKSFLPGSDGGAAAGAAFARGGSVFAQRGMVRGPGTSTSDSIAAWLSNNEYVVRAKSVAKYGKGFMDAINSGRLSLDGIRHFAAGGLVSFTQPRLAFAAGGPVDTQSANRIVNLTIGDQRFENLLAPEDVADRMERYAVARNTTSAGRKPSWVGGSR